MSRDWAAWFKDRVKKYHDKIKQKVGAYNIFPGTGGSSLPMSEEEEKELKKKWGKNTINKMKEYASDRRPSAGTIAVIVIGVFVVATGFIFTTQNALFNSFIDNTVGPSLKTTFNSINNQIQITWCVIDKSFIVRLIKSPLDPKSLNEENTGPDLYAYCQQQLQLVFAEDIGCNDCFSLSTSTLQFSVPAEPGSEAVVRAVIRAVDEKYLQDGEDYPIPPADDAIFYIEDQDGNKASLDSNLQLLSSASGTESPNQLTGRLNPAVLYKSPLIVEGYFDVSKMCSSRKTKIDASAVLNYSYRTDGQAYINVKKFSTKDSSNAFTKRNSVVFPGPVKIDIIPDSNLYGGVYSADLIKKARIEIRFRNEGVGKAEIKKVIITQTPPEGQSPLPLTRCSGIVSSSNLDPESGSIEIETKIKLGRGDRSSSSISCTLDLTGVGSVPGDYPQWRIDGSVFYNYEVESLAQTILIDKSSCQESNIAYAYDEKTAASPSNSKSGSEVNGKQSGGGSGGGDSSNPTTCNSPAPESKECPGGQSLLDNGCCG
jgi:hypothetical protein